MYDTSVAVTIYHFNQASQTVFYLGKDFIMSEVDLTTDSSAPVTDVHSTVTMTTNHYDTSSQDKTVTMDAHRVVTMATNEYDSSSQDKIVTMENELTTDGHDNKIRSTIATDEQSSVGNAVTSASPDSTPADLSTTLATTPESYMWGESWLLHTKHSEFMTNLQVGPMFSCWSNISGLRFDQHVGQLTNLLQ